MSFEQAVKFLAETYTRDHCEMGFQIAYTPPPWVTAAELADAWRVVREHFHMQTEPPEGRR